MLWLLVCLFAGLGAVTRFVLDTSIQRWWDRAFPLSTLLINLLAAFCIGMAAAAYLDQTVGRSTYMVFALGFCGGFATFSTAVGEVVSLGVHRRGWSTVLYVAVMVVGSLSAIALGWWLASLGH